MIPGDGMKDLPTCKGHHEHYLDMPAGYVAQANWAKLTLKTHRQEPCSVCGLWTVWKEKMPHAN